MITGLFNRSRKLYEIADVNEDTGEKVVLNTVATKDARDYEVFRAEYPDVYQAAVKVFSDEFRTNKRLLRAAQMFVAGTVPMQAGASTWVVRSQSNQDDGTTYRAHRNADGTWECTCDDAQAGNMPWVHTAGASLCKHAALVLLAYEI